jgi:hypothetical protein
MNLIIKKDLLAAKREAVKQLMNPASYSNVLAVGTGTGCVRIYTQSIAKGRGNIPANFGGFQTKVIDIGRLGRLGPLKEGMALQGEIKPGSKIRVKTNAPNVNPRASGTLGAVVRDGHNNYFILSCNHTLAVNGRVRPGTEIVSAAFVGRAKKLKPIATFLGRGYFVEITSNINFVDCALAKLDADTIKTKFADSDLAKLKPPIPPQPNMKVQKVGGVTGLTKGIIEDIKVDVSVDYSFGTFRFNDQVLIKGDDEQFAWDGDSGSIVTNMDGEPTAMIFAEAGRFAVACPLSTVFELLGKELDRVLKPKEVPVNLELVLT